MAEGGQMSAPQLRLQIVLDHLELTHYALAQSLKVVPNRITRAMNKKQGIDTELLFKIAHKWPEINMHWIVTGKGSMMMDSKDPTLVNDPITEYMVAPDIRVVPGDYFNDYRSRFMDSKWIKNLPKANNLHQEPGIYRDFEIPSNHMHDPMGFGINPGDIIRTQKIEDALWSHVFVPGTIGVFVTELAVYARMVDAIDSVKDKLQLMAWNRIYKSEKLKLSEIREAWLYRSLQTQRDFKDKYYDYREKK